MLDLFHYMGLVLGCFFVSFSNSLLSVSGIIAGLGGGFFFLFSAGFRQ